MSLEDDDVLNSTSKSRRIVETLNALNEAVSNFCKLGVLHLDHFIEIGLPLKDANSKYIEDHAAVCEGIHEFAVTSQKLSNQFNFYSQVAFAHILKHGVDVDIPAQTQNNPTSAAATSLSPKHSQIPQYTHNEPIIVDEIPLPSEPFNEKLASNVSMSVVVETNQKITLNTDHIDKPVPSLQESSHPEKFSAKNVTDRLKAGEYKKIPYAKEMSLNQVCTKDDEWLEFAQCTNCDKVMETNGEELKHAQTCNWRKEETQREVPRGETSFLVNKPFIPVFPGMKLSKRTSNGLFASQPPSKNLHL